MLKADLLAGLTIALMVLPQGVAYAALAGMPLVTGIYAAFLPGLVAALWGSSTRLSVGPTALTCLLIGSSLAPLATPGSALWVQLAVWLALMSGAMQLLLGVGRFGWLLNLVSSPVLTGFTQGAALLILWSQVPKLLGLGGPAVSLEVFSSLHGAAAAFGLGSLATLLLMKRWKPSFPSTIAVVGASAAISYALGAQQSGTPIVGALPAGLPAFTLPTVLPWPMLDKLLLPAMVITLVSYLETASSARREHELAGTRWNENQDLIAQGLAKLVSAICGAFPTSTSFSRAAISLQAGALTGWATVVCTAIIGLALLVLMPTLYFVPQSVLAGVVVAAVAGLVKPDFLFKLWRISKMETATAAITFALTLYSAPNLYWGVLAGLLISLSHFLYHRLHPRIIEVGLHPDGSLRDRHLWNLPILAPNLYALRMDAELDFASASGFGAAIDQHLTKFPATRYVCLFAQPINRIDVTGVEAFVELRRSLTARGICLYISGIKLPVETALERAGALAPGPHLHLFRTDPDALAALSKLGQTV